MLLPVGDNYAVNIVISGRVPSKKNSKQIVCRGRFPQVLPSKQYKEWHEIAMYSVMKQRQEHDQSDHSFPMTPFQATFTIFAPDARKFDLSNKFESVADLLVDCGIIADDHYGILSRVLLQFGGIDRENPRAEILLQI